MTHARCFPLAAEAVAAARRFTLDALSGLPAEVCEVVELMVSELATNAIRHSHTAFELRLQRRGGEIRVEVSDAAGGTPAMRSPGPEDPRGRGLQIVNMLSSKWGVEPRADGGKTVWFVTSAAGAPAA